MWQPIDTAPKDGTVIRVKNDQMDEPVDAAWGKYRSRATGQTYDQFVTLGGALVIPTHWQPA
jgi:hypothetical protein